MAISLSCLVDGLDEEAVDVENRPVNREKARREAMVLPVQQSRLRGTSVTSVAITRDCRDHSWHQFVLFTRPTTDNRIDCSWKILYALEKQTILGIAPRLTRPSLNGLISESTPRSSTVLSFAHCTPLRLSCHPLVQPWEPTWTEHSSQKCLPIQSSHVDRKTCEQNHGAHRPPHPR